MAAGVNLPGQGSPPADAAQVEAVLMDVLSRAEFQSAPQSLAQAWLTGLAGWFREHVWQRLTDLLPALDWSGERWEMATRVLVGLGALLGIVLVAYLGVHAARAFRRRRRRSRGASGPPRASRSLTWEEWEAQSREAAIRGDWRGAALGLYQSVLLRLGDAGVIRIDGTKTPGDYRREVRRSGAEVGPAVDTFFVRFERVAYGRRGDGAAEYDRLRQAAAKLSGA